MSYNDKTLPHTHLSFTLSLVFSSLLRNGLPTPYVRLLQPPALTYTPGPAATPTSSTTAPHGASIPGQCTQVFVLYVIQVTDLNIN